MVLLPLLWLLRHLLPLLVLVRRRWMLLPLLLLRGRLLPRRAGGPSLVRLCCRGRRKRRRALAGRALSVPLRLLLVLRMLRWRLVVVGRCHVLLLLLQRALLVVGRSRVGGLVLLP